MIAVGDYVVVGKGRSEVVRYRGKGRGIHLGTHLGVQLEGPYGDCAGRIERERLDTENHTHQFTQQFICTLRSNNGYSSAKL